MMIFLSLLQLQKLNLSEHTTVGTHNKRLRNRIKKNLAICFCADRFSMYKYVQGTRHKESTGDKELFCAYQLLPFSQNSQ